MISMRANYVSYFRNKVGLEQTKLTFQNEAEASDAVGNVEQLSYPKIKRGKPKVLVAEESKLYLQYSLDL